MLLVAQSSTCVLKMQKTDTKSNAFTRYGHFMSAESTATRKAVYRVFRIENRGLIEGNVCRVIVREEDKRLRHAYAEAFNGLQVGHFFNARHRLTINLLKIVPATHKARTIRVLWKSIFCQMPAQVAAAKTQLVPAAQNYVSEYPGGYQFALAQRSICTGV